MLSLFNSLPQMAFLVSEKMRIKQINEKGQELLGKIGLSVNEYEETKNYSDLLKDTGCDDKKVKMIEMKINELFEGTQEDFTEEILLKGSESEQWLRIHVSRYKEHVVIVKEDINEVKKLQESLRGSESRLQTSVSETPDAIYAFEVEEGTPQFTYVDDEIEEILGYKPKDFIENKNFWRECVHPDDREKLSGNPEKFQRGGSISLKEYRFQDKEGNYLWLYDKQRLIKHEDGSREVVGAWWDITERKNTEKELEMTKFSLDNADMMIFRVTPEGEIVYANKKAKDRLGYSSEKLTGKNVQEIIPEEEIIEPKEFWARLKQQDSIKLEEKYVTKEGEIFPVSVVAQYFKYETEEYSFLFARDITKEKREKEKLEAIFEASRNVSFVITEPTEDGEDALIKEFSPGAENLFGYTKEEVIDKSVSILHSSEEVERFDEIHGQLSQGERWEDKVELIRKNGERFPAFFTVYPFKSGTDVNRTLGISIEITELEETREKLEQTKNQLEAILESIQDGISVLDPDLTIRYTNSTMEKWYEENAPLQGQKCYQAYHNKNKTCSDCPTLRSLESGEVEKEIITGLEVSDIDYLELFTYPMIDENTDEVTGVVEFVRDITERKKTEKKLELTQFSLENADMMIFRVTPEGEILYINEHVSRKLGYSREEMKKMNVSEIIPEEDFVERGEFWQQIKQNDSISYEQKFISAEDEVFPVSMVSQYFSYGNEEYEFVFARDITERKEIEKKLRVREEQYRKIFETAPVGIMLEDSEGNILEVNDRLCQISGFSEEELVGSNVLETLTPEEHKAEARKNIEKIIAGEDLEFTGESRRKNGERYYSQLHETKVTLPQGNEGILSIQLDITELKEKEERLEYLSFHDGLTGLYNRSFLKEEMQRLDTKRQLPVSLIMCDVNGLKIINDTYGHKKGDELLNKVAEILQDVTRDEDIVSRWAGDEFVILLPQTDREIAESIAGRIEGACESSEFGDIPITLGIGIAVKKSIKEEYEDVLAKADERMYEDKLTKAKSGENRLVENMLSTLAAKSAETKDHARRMTVLVHKLGGKSGLSNEQLNRLSLLATLHDVGKTTISEDLLTKPGDLSQEEWQTMKKHSERGHNILTATDDFAHIAKEVLHHHERWDGTGYPEGLEGKDIPLLSRMIAIVDAYDVMTTGRPYKEAMSKEEALQEIEDCAGSQFDPELAKEFVELMRNSED